MSSKTLKILACGDVKGQIGGLIKRVETVNKKAGPFEMVLCVGQFFDESSGGVDDQKLWSEITSDKKSLPCPVYILGPISQTQLALFPNLDGCEFGSNICYLGRNGIFTTKEGLKIAYVSGVDKPEEVSAKKLDFHLDYERVRAMEVRAKCHESNFQGVDIFLSTDWPKGILTYCGPVEGVTSETGSPLLARLAVNLRPRYHFAGSRQVHFERLPYRNHKVISESTRHVTRFIGLAEVGNPEKKKWIYAFNIVPMSVMDRSELVAQPPNVTEFPYKESHMKLATKPASGENQFFYDMNAPMTDNDKKKRRHNNDEGGEPRQKRPPPKPTGPCWFCLSGAEVEKHLVVSIGEHSYLALPKGGLTPHHVLILPIAHHPTSLELPDEVSSEIEKFKNALRKCFKKVEGGQEMVFFERNYKSQHLQLQAVPVPKEVSHQIKFSFEDAGESMELEMTSMPDHATLAQMVQPGSPYFYAELPNNVKLYHRVRRGFPIQFGREVLASPEILNIPDRVDWRACQLSKDEETRMTLEFRELFKPYDFTLE